MQPLEWTVKQKGKNIRVVLRTGKVYTGVLVDYDDNVNLLMSQLTLWNTEEYIGQAILNGATVAYIESI
ncbi:U6 snRNA-associated Sm-like protein LSm5 [Nematocida sp. AWRm77]|nr:U6 snRNA-associated Sm-like protein LSm5 [Nematocida sp. AWRm77]